MQVDDLSLDLQNESSNLKLLKRKQKIGMEKVFNFLKQHNVTTIATVADNKPRASIIEYYVVDNSIIFATAQGSIKAGNLAKNDKVSLSVIKLPMFATIDGRVVEPSEEEIAKYSEQLLAVHPEFIEKMEQGLLPPFAYFKLDIDEVYYSDYSSGSQAPELIKFK